MRPSVCLQHLASTWVVSWTGRQYLLVMSVPIIIRIERKSNILKWHSPLYVTINYLAPYLSPHKVMRADPLSPPYLYGFLAINYNFPGTVYRTWLTHNRAHLEDSEPLINFSQDPIYTLICDSLKEIRCCWWAAKDCLRQEVQEGSCKKHRSE